MFLPKGMNGGHAKDEEKEHKKKIHAFCIVIMSVYRGEDNIAILLSKT